MYTYYIRRYVYPIRSWSPCDPVWYGHSHATSTSTGSTTSTSRTSSTSTTNSWMMSHKYVYTIWYMYIRRGPRWLNQPCKTQRPITIDPRRMGPDYLPNMEPEPPAAEVCEGFGESHKRSIHHVDFCILYFCGFWAILWHWYNLNFFGRALHVFISVEPVFSRNQQRAEWCSSLTKVFSACFFLGFAVLMMEWLLAAENSWCQEQKTSPSSQGLASLLFGVQTGWTWNGWPSKNNGKTPKSSICS